MTLHVLNQNVSAGFGRERSAEGLIAWVGGMDPLPDAAAFPEAFKQDQTVDLDGLRDQFAQAGYRMEATWYRDPGGRADKNGMVSIVRKGLVLPSQTSGAVLLATRYALRQSLRDPDTGKAVDFWTVHFDDRSEAGRWPQAFSLVRQMTPGRPTIVSGDMNAQYATETGSLAMLAVGVANKLVQVLRIPVTDPTGKPMRSTLGRIASDVTRLHGTANGQTMAILQEGGLHDADLARQPTFPARLPVAEIDHTVHTSQLRSVGFRVLPRMPGLDHRGTVATLEVRPA